MDAFFVFIINQDNLLVMMSCSLVGVHGYSIMYPNAGGTSYTEIYWEIINKPLLLHLVGYLYYWQMGFNSVFKGLIFVWIFQ